MNRFDDLRARALPLVLPLGIERLAVFGSYARGDETPESDIDLLVWLKPPEERPPIGLRWFGVEEELRHALGRDVELVAEDALSPYVRPYVERDLVVLYDEG